ncbi:hypothetical protein HK102_006830, partial [Quaeritorhiza haematococci]
MDLFNFDDKSKLTLAVTGASLLVALPLVRRWAAGGKTDPFDLSKNLTGKVAIVTGSNTGIGFQTALQLAKQGATVCIASRPSEKTERACRKIRELSGSSQVFVEGIDLSSLASVRAFCERWQQSSRPIHYLINNAGVMAIPTKTLTKDGFEMQIGTNHIGHFVLTTTLLPIIKASGTKEEPARIVNLSSSAHQIPKDKAFVEDLNFEKTTYNEWGAYG